jgi:hypothetical protein
MANSKIVGYKNIFGFVLPDWVDEATIKLLVTFLLSAAAMLFVLIIVVWPKFETIETLKVSLANKLETLGSLKSSKSGLDKLNEQIPETTQNLILSAIPQSYSPENAVFMLRKIASETPGLAIVSYNLPSGVLFDSSSKSTAKETKSASKDLVSFATYPIRLTVTAQVDSLLMFVNKIETSLPLGVVSDLGMQEVTKMAKSAVTAPVQMDLEVSYYQALLNQVDISVIEPISTEDLAWVKKMAAFTRIGALLGSEVVASASAVTVSGNLFGF